MQVISAGTDAAGGRRELIKRAAERFVKGSTGGPDAAARAKSGSRIVAIAYDCRPGASWPRLELTGVDGYTFTGRILAWGAERAA